MVRIYNAALTKAMELNNLSFDPKKWIWIHVGKDLANDVLGVSAQIGAKTIWFTSNYGDEKGKKGIGFWSSATPEE
jgi:hypothetical protein